MNQAAIHQVLEVHLVEAAVMIAVSIFQILMKETLPLII
jgi:hypothetical protein